MRLRCAGSVQSRQGVSHFVGLCGTRPHPCSWRPAAASPFAALLMNKADTPAQVVEFVRAAHAGKTPFEIVAGGTRRGVGKPLNDLPLLDVSGLSGILKYE